MCVCTETLAALLRDNGQFSDGEKRERGERRERSEGGVVVASLSLPLSKSPSVMCSYFWRCVEPGLLHVSRDMLGLLSLPSGALVRTQLASHTTHYDAEPNVHESCRCPKFVLFLMLSFVFCWVPHSPRPGFRIQKFRRRPISPASMEKCPW